MAAGPSASRPLSVAKDDDPGLWQEQNKLYNFLKHYDLHQYYTRFVDNGIKRMTHLKDVSADDASLADIGLSRPERIRLRKKVKENIEVFGKLKKKIMGKSNKFDDPAPEVAHSSQDSITMTRSAAIIPKDQIQLKDRIGEGAHGAVHEGTWSNVHGSVAVAVKRLYGRQEVQSQFIKEANSMCLLNHNNIIRLYGIVLSEPLMLIEELAPLGNMHSYLHKNGARLTLKTFYIYVCQIADAMKYLEKNRIVHRDLAARNILLVQEDCVKLSDFGMARVLDEQSDVYNLSNLGARIPVAWTAIEALTRAKFSSASDVWSYGVVLWEIYSLGQTPFEGLSPIEVRDLLRQGERLGRPERCPIEMYSLIESCWQLEPQNRPLFAELHQRVLAAPPTLVRAIKSHQIADDNSYLSFNTGEIIFVIDKPKPEWIFGMSGDGSIGQLSSDHVTTVIDGLGDVKAKLNSGKVKASELSISDPTSVDHMLHWGSDGEKWKSGDQDLGTYENYHRPGSPSRIHNGRKSPSGISPAAGRRGNSTYLQLITRRSPSPVPAPNSPLLVGVSSPVTTSSFSFTTAESASRSGAMVDYKTPEIGTSQVSYGDANFVGTQRYTPSRDSYLGQTDQHVHRESETLRPLSPPDFCRLASEDNSYISMSRINAADPDVIKRLSQRKTKPDSPSPTELSDQEDPYIKMNPHSILAAIGSHSPHSKHNYTPGQVVVGQYREEVPGYAVPQTRQRILSEPTDNRESIIDEGIPSSGSQLPDPMQPVGGANSRALSQYSVAGDSGTVPLHEAFPQRSHGEALMPQSVRFFNRGGGNNTAGSSNPTQSARLSSASMPKDHSRQRPVVAPRRLNSHKEMDALTNPYPTSTNSQFMESAGTGWENRGPTRRSSEGGLPEASAQHPYPIPKPRQMQVTATTGPVSQSLRQQPAIIHEEPKPLFTQSIPAIRAEVLQLPGLDRILSDPEFSDCQPDVVRRALLKHRSDFEKVKEEIRVQKLLDMCIPNINNADCRRALSHCQQKTDRAAEWLLQLSLDVEERAQ